MTYLLGQIVLCLLLAALAGWFIGWSWRGFREQDRVEDLRRTLRATEEVKDRDLSESQRREESLRARVETLERRSERLADELSVARRGTQDDSPAHGHEQPEARRTTPLEGFSLAAADGPPGPFGVDTAEIQGMRDDLDRMQEELARERERRRESEEALRDKTSALLSLQAELGGLRAGTEERAGHVAHLERRVVELEPLEERLERREAEFRELQARLREAGRDRHAEGGRTRDLDRQSAVLQEQLRERDRRINQVRNDYNDIRARLELVEAERERLRQRVEEGEREYAEVVRYRTAVTETPRLQARLEECSQRLQQVEDQLDEARTALRQQIERNRKQETIHQQVIARLRAEVSGDSAAGDTTDSSGRRR